MCATLSGGEQQMLAISRALMSRPRLMLLDEPSLETGEVVMASPGRELVQSPEIRKAYLGE